MFKKKKEKIKEGKSLWDDSLACGCWHLPSPAIKAKGHTAWPPTGPYHIRDTEAVLWCPSPNLSRPLSHSCHFSRERPLSPWALDYSLSLASPWRHKPTFLLICTCPCLHPHALHSTFLAGHTHQSNRPCRVNSFTCLSPWPKTLLKVEQILFAKMDQSIYWCPDSKSWDLSHKPLSLISSQPVPPQDLKLCESYQVGNSMASSPHCTQQSLHNQASLLASTQVASMREPVLHSRKLLDTPEISTRGGSIKLKITRCIY